MSDNDTCEEKKEKSKGDAQPSESATKVEKDGKDKEETTATGCNDKPSADSDIHKEGVQLKVELPALGEDQKEQSGGDKMDSEEICKDSKESELSQITAGAMAAVAMDNMDTDSQDGPSVYQVKWINFRNKEVPIITQNENGPCPLLAIMNVLLLKGKVKFAPGTEIITPEQLMTHLGECILENAPKVCLQLVCIYNYKLYLYTLTSLLFIVEISLNLTLKGLVRDWGQCLLTKI